MTRWAALVAVAMMSIAVATGMASLAAAAPQATLADLEDEVMCPICGTLLELSSSPQAERQRVFVSRLIAAGETKAEIKDALVAEYGREVLATPAASGFDLSAYLVPALGFAAAALALAIGVGRWRRTTREAAGSERGGEPDEEEAQRLDADLARYDL